MNYSLHESERDICQEDIYRLYSLEIGQIKTVTNILFKKYYKTISLEKEKIDTLENTNQWDRLKKVGNPYELIYISNNKKRKNESISKYIPISRSYFKLWEIFHVFRLFENKEMKGSVFSHLAEGPGGFMEATYNFARSKNVKGASFHCITLPPINHTIPDFNKIKKIFSGDANVFIEYGNLYIIDDVMKYIRRFEKERAFLVTADGGFDYSNNFNGQEINSCQIIFSEMVVALNILKKGGVFICKIFDIFSLTMIQILYILSLSFHKVHIYKPETSRPANSEKYLVCIGFNDAFSDLLKMNLLQMIEQWATLPIKNDECVLFKNIRINNNFIQKIDEYNKQYMEKQIYFLKSTLDLSPTTSSPSSSSSYQRIEKDKYHKIIDNQVENAMKWCNKYHIEINKESIFYKTSS